MCGRYTLFADYEQILERFNVGVAFDEENYSPNFNVAPTHSVISIINDGSSNRLGTLRWGLIPSWAKDEKIGYKMINARSETVDEKPSFRHAFLKKRCIIPMDSFYEWKVKGNVKVPMRIKMKSDEVFGVAGLWEAWKNANGQTIHSCTIITTEANSLVKDIHDRMPVILTRENEKEWLDPFLQEKEKLKSFLIPYDAALIDAYPVSSEVNSPKNNHIGLINSL
ncbi:SOS response-associated peptidase [Psychrobacillus sp. OK032]|uniref:SOS response-associated peptidase n=1 Tax=Psychrobacillus sp. OK032 TaxID=1884358 RepID=UPI0008BE319B|nr:SOS response-associated peptidase [Psychrobacillus sp. OK032]SES45665.1 Putative SOS response-associated peptidase YedK [Psychrobacillus sp. OK032]